MEITSNTLTTENIVSYSENNHQCAYEREILKEILQHCKQNDSEILEWFAQFGNDIRTIIFNVHTYRMGLRFGFSEIAFDTYGWFTRPTFLDLEELRFGLIDTDRFGNYSTITLGRGINDVWTFGISVSYGTAGSSSGICVYSKCFSSREDALSSSTDQLKMMMQNKLRDKDTTNYNQKVITATLKDLEKLKVSKIQLSLF